MTGSTLFARVELIGEAGFGDPTVDAGMLFKLESRGLDGFGGLDVDEGVE